MGSYLFTEFISAQQPPSTSPFPNFLNPKGSLVFIAWQYRHPALQFYFFLKKKKKALQFYFFFIIIIIIYACVQLQRLQKVFKRTAILNFKLALSHCHGTRKKKKVWDSLMKLISHSMYRFHLHSSHILWEIMRPSHEIPSPPWSESRNCGSIYWVKT